MKIRAVSEALPKNRFSSAQIAAWTDTEENFIVNKIGISSRRFLAEDETVSDLAGEACEKLFNDNPELDSATVGLLILITQNPDHRLPHTSALLQDRLQLPNQCACFDVSLGCSGYVYGLTVAKGVMSAQGISDGILVTCDPYSKIMARDDKNTVAVFGDAATATWLSTDAGAAIGVADLGTDGSGAEYLIVPAGGSAQSRFDIWKQDPVSFSRDDERLHMNGRAIFNFMMTRVPETVSACLEKNELAMEDIDLFAFHQASAYLLKTLQRQLKIPDAKMLIDMEDCGNTVSSTIPLLLARQQRNGGLDGKIVLISGFGVGLSWASNIIRF